ncbi:MAG: c-type cytochrome domain-containing protein [Planctomycetota bacterium]
MHCKRVAGGLMVAVVLAQGMALQALAQDVATTPQPTPKEIRETLNRAREMLDEGKPSKASEILAKAAKQLEQLAALPRPPSGARALADRCESLKDDLELEGIDVTGITIPSVKSSATKAVAPPVAVGATGSVPNRKGAKPQGVSFTGQVAPMLVKHCGGCHIAGKKGEFQMVSYEGLMRSGMVQSGNGISSRLVDVIQTGDMPRGGGKVAPDELATLIRWIDMGATFDGPDPTVRMNAIGPVVVPGAAIPPVALAKPVPLKPGDISFALDIAPVLLKQCVGCHHTDTTGGGLGMVSLESLQRGGASGATFVAGKGADSLLIKKLKGVGIQGQRMPRGKSPLSETVIAMVEKWIDQGAKLDILTPQAALETVAATGRAKHLSHEELAEQRFSAGALMWKRALADEKATIVTRGSVCVVGNLSQSRSDEIATAAEASMATVQKVIRGDVRPIVKGGVVLFVFAKPYDYSNFWQTIRGQERPKGLTAHAGVLGDVAYGALTLSTASEGVDAAADLALVTAEQMTAAAFMAAGATEWFASGAGRTVAIKVAAKAPLAQAWRQEVPNALAGLSSPAEFLAGNAGPVATATMSGAFVGSLAASGAKLRMLLDQLDAGTPFEAAFSDVFRGTPLALFEAWAAKEARKPVRRT